MKKIVPDPPILFLYQSTNPPPPDAGVDMQIPQMVAWPHSDIEKGLQQLARLLRSANESNYHACEEADCKVEPLIWNTQFMLEAAQAVLESVQQVVAAKAAHTS